MAEAIKVDGLNEFVKNLRKLDSDLPKTLRIAFNDVANVIIDYARPRVPSRSGNARRSIRAQSTRTAVRVAAGGRKAPYYPWLDFGGSVGKRKSVKRPFIKEGRYLFKGYHAEHEKIIERMQQALVETARSAGIEVE